MCQKPTQLKDPAKNVLKWIVNVVTLKCGQVFKMNVFN